MSSKMDYVPEEDEDAIYFVLFKDGSILFTKNKPNSDHYREGTQILEAPEGMPVGLLRDWLLGFKKNLSPICELLD